MIVLLFLQRESCTELQAYKFNFSFGKDHLKIVQKLFMQYLDDRISISIGHSIYIKHHKTLLNINA